MARIIDVDPSGRIESVRSEEAEQIRRSLQRLAWLLGPAVAQELHAVQGANLLHDSLLQRLEVGPHRGNLALHQG